MLNFLNYAAEVARCLGVSRQMVSRTVGEPSKPGLLEVVTDPAHGNPKVIAFTPDGERLMADSRHILATLDRSLLRELNASEMKRTIEILGHVHGQLKKGTGAE